LRKSEWDLLKSWGKAKNYIGEIKFIVKDNEYRINREFETNKVEFIKRDKKGNIETLFNGSAAPQSRTEEKEFYLAALREVIGINNENVFYNTNVVLQKSIEAEIGSEVQQIITGAVGTNYKNVLENWREKYFEFTKKSIWDDASDKRNDRKMELIEKQIKELEDRKEKVIEASIKTSKIEEKLFEMEKELSKKEDELKKLRINFELVKKYNNAVQRYNMLKTRNKEILEEIERIKEINIELKNKEKILKENYSDYEKIPEKVIDEYKTLKKLKEELTGEEKELNEILVKRMPLFSRKIILSINGFIIAGLTFLTGIKFKLPVLFIIAIGVGFITLGFLIYSIIKHSKERFERETLINFHKEKIENIKHKIVTLNNNLAKYILLLKDENFEYKFEQYKKLSDEIGRLKFTIQKMKNLDDLKNTQSDIENDMLVITKMISELEENNPFLSKFRDNIRDGVGYVNELSGNIETLEREIEDLKSKIFETKQQLASTFTENESVESLDNKIQELRDEYKNYLFQKESYAEAVNTLKEAILEYQERHLERLSRNISEIFRKITKGRYINIGMTKDFVPMIKFKDSKIVRINTLSCGAEEQLYFAIRLALIREINNVTNLPLILDDPFVNFDQERLRIVREILYSLVPENQIILFTHIQSYSNWKNINLLSL